MKIARILLALVAVILLFGSLACSSEPVQFTEADTGITQFLRNGQKAILTLEMSTDGEFIWQVDVEDKTIVEIVAKDLQIVNDDLESGSMKRIITFKAWNSGKTTVTASLVRPAEPTKPERTVTFNVEVL